MALGFCIIMHIGKRGCSVCTMYNALAKLKRMGRELVGGFVEIRHAECHRYERDIWERK